MHLNSDQEDIVRIPSGTEFGALTEGGKTIGVGFSGHFLGGSRIGSFDPYC